MQTHGRRRIQDRRDNVAERKATWDKLPTGEQYRFVFVLME